tara:strand:+ start:1041 stop:1451 length:411 start_codon:yes stop_codon:yes gene_type:complete
MYTNDRLAYRKIFFEVWEKHKKNLLLEHVEAQVQDVILTHPEYHNLLDNPKTFMTQEFTLEENPFFHMSLHIAVREQIQLDRPAGVKHAYQTLVKKMQSPDMAEHHMTTVLAQMMYQSQQVGENPDEALYLKKLAE